MITPSPFTWSCFGSRDRGWMGGIWNGVPGIWVLKGKKVYLIPKATEDQRSVFWNTFAYEKLCRAGKTVIASRKAL